MENRIEINPRVMAGKPMIKGTRIPIYLILDLLAAGYKSKDIVAAIEYASGILKREEVVEVKA